MAQPEYQGIIKPKGLEGLKGLRGWNELSQEEQSSWLESHPKALNLSPLKRSVAYRNNNYLETLGKEVYDKYDIATLGELYRDKVVSDAVKDYYSNDPTWNLIESFTTEGKQELLESGYLNDQEFSDKLQDEYKLYSELQDKAAKRQDFAGPVASMAVNTKLDEDAYMKPWIDARNANFEKILAKDNKRKVDQSQGDIDALYDFYKNGQEAWLQASSDYLKALEGNGNIDDVINQMAVKGIITPELQESLLSRDAEEKGALVGLVLLASGFNPVLTYLLFDDIALPKEVTQTTEFGDVTYQMPGSRTYRGLKDTDRFNNFTAGEMLKNYVTWQTLANKYGTTSAVSNLETSMMEYAHDHETAGDWWSDVGRNILFGGMANIMNKVNAVGNMITESKYGTEGLANKLEGKNADGSERDQSGNWFINNWDNPYYWSKVDEYNTLDPLEIANIDALGGVSPYTTVRTLESPDFFSTETLKEGLKMMKFVWSDYLVNKALGGVAKGASKGATRVGGPKFGRFVNKTGALATVAASGMGIAESYGVMTYEQTYLEMMEKLNAKRDAEAQQTVEEFMQTPENQKKIDDIVKQRVAELKAGSEGNVTVFEDEIRKQVERDFINHYTQMYNNEESTKADREQDENIARRAAANAYMVDATIEEIRMAAVNFAFKKYLFDKGTLKALGDDLNYSNVTAAEDGTLTTTRQGLERAKAVIKPVWGGFESNYFDDVTVGFGKGFGLGQYNAYLQNKYDASKAAETSGYTLSFIDGLDSALTGASEALFDRQSFYDGFVGALGTPLSIMPRLGRGDRAQALEGMNRTDATSLTFGEKINKWFMNPLLEAYYNERGKQERTNEILPYVNRAITKDRDALENINQMVIGLKDMSVSDISGSVLQRKDAKDRQAFRLLYVMNGMDTAPLIQESPIVANAAQVIDRMADGNITDQEVHDFLNQPGNKDIQQQENPEQIARDRIQKNAKTLQDMSRKIADSRELIENSILGRNIDKDLKEQLVFNIAMGKTWEERLADMQETLTGNRQINTAHNAVAAYGNKEEYQRQKDALGDLILSLMGQITRARAELKRSTNLYNDIKDNAAAQQSAVEEAKNLVLKDQLYLLTLGETLREAKVKLKEMERDGSAFESAEVPVLNAEQIIALRPSDRYTILNKKNRDNYSEEQQVEIDKAISTLQTKDPDAAQTVKDSATLETRIDDNNKAYRRLWDNPDAAAAYVSTINSSRADQLTRAYAQKRIDNAYKLFDAATSDEELTAIAKNALNSKELGMNSRHLEEYIKKNPDKKPALQGLLDVSKIREDAFNAIANVVTSPDARNAIVQLFVNATNDANNADEAMEALESLIDIQSDNTAKLQYDRILEKMQSYGHLRSATILRDREKERKKQEKAEQKRQEKEAKKDGKNYDWDGYKVGDTVYSKETGHTATVVGFEKNEDGSFSMLLKVKGLKNPVRYNSVTGKEKITKEQPKSEEAAPETANMQLKLTSGEILEIAGTPEEVGEVNLSLDDEGKVDSPSAAEQAEAERVTVQEVPTTDASELGNILPEGQATVISGNRYVEYSIDALKEGKIEQEVPESSNSIFGRLMTWLTDNKIKLQEIIDEEFGRIIADNPDIEVRFMMMKQSDTSNPLQKTIFNVIEFTPEVQKYHDDSRGGIIQANGKQWLVVGTTGFAKNATTDQISAYDAMKSPISQRRMDYFKTNPSESYYVDQVAYSKVLNTTSGRIVNQREGSEVRLKKVSELLKSAGMSLRQAAFGIQTRQAGTKSFATTKNVAKDAKVFPPRNAEDNRGRVFILLDTANGNKIPGIIEPAMLNEISEDSPLRKMINATVARLFSTNYAVRSEAIKELCGYLVLNDEKNILIGKERLNILTIRTTMGDVTLSLGEKFDVAKFFKDLENANFQINVTLRTLNDPVMLKMYDDSNALMTTIDSMRTAGMSYTLYTTDDSGRPIILTPVGNATPGTGRTELTTYRSVRVGNTTYELKNGQFVNRYTGGIVNPGTSLERSCQFNLDIQEGNWEPFKTEAGLEYYQIQYSDGKTYVITRDGLGNVEFMDYEASQKMIKESQEKQAQQARELNLEDVNLDDTPVNPEAPQPVPELGLTQDQINQQLVGNFDTPAESTQQQQTPTEVVEEAKEGKSEQPKEVITNVGKKSLSELQNTENLSTFAEVATSDKYSDILYEVLEEKGWGVTGDPATDIEILKSHNIAVTGIDNVESWIDLIKGCR